MSSKKKMSRCSALSSPYVSRLPSTDRRLSRAAGTTAVAAERSDPARDMGLQPAGPGRADFFGLLLWGGQQTLVGPRENLERLLWIRLHFRLLSPQFGVLLWHPCPARTRFRGVDAMGGGRCILHGSGTCSGTGALACAHLSAGKK